MVSTNTDPMSLRLSPRYNANVSSFDKIDKFPVLNTVSLNIIYILSYLVIFNVVYSHVPIKAFKEAYFIFLQHSFQYKRVYGCRVFYRIRNHNLFKHEQFFFFSAQINDVIHEDVIPVIKTSSFTKATLAKKLTGLS